MARKTTKIQKEKLTAMLEDAIEYRKDYEEQVGTVETIYNADYDNFGGLGSEYAGSSSLVKTHGLYTQVRRTVAMMMPPPYMEFITEPANKEQDPDISSAEVAKYLLDYLFNIRDGRVKVSEGLHDLCLTNFMRFRLAFKEDNRIESMEENVMAQSDGVASEVIDTGDDKVPGQPFFFPINWKDFLICRGYKNVEEAWNGGGWVARQFYPLNEWVVNNTHYKNNRDLEPDAQWRGQEVVSKSSSTNRGEHDSNLDYNYNCLWEIFCGPTKDYPKGRYIIHSLLQNKTLYDFSGKCFKGLNIPIVEMPMFSGRANKYYVPPLSHRSINPLLTWEYFASRELIKNATSKSLVAIRTDVVGDETRDKILGDDPVWIGNTDSLNDAKQGPPFTVTELALDVENDRIGAMNARARFENLWGFSTADPRAQGDQIATELVLQNKIYLSEMNDLIIRVNKCVEQIANGMLVISKEKMSPAEMDRIVRMTNEAWNDDNQVTLEGNYGVRVKTKQLYDMTEGERSKVLQMWFSTLGQATALPALANRIDVIPALKAWGVELGMPVSKIFKESQKISQEWETTQILLGNMIQVQPEDDHIAHIASIDETFMTIEMTKETSTGAVDASYLQNLMAHRQQHEQFIKMMQQGSKGVSNQTNNPVNDSRSAGAETIRSAGASGTIGETNQPEGA